MRGGIYGRLSLAIMGDTAKVDDQLNIGRRLLESYPAPVVVDPRHIFRDDSKSAWRRDRKRPGWNALLEVVHELDLLAIYHGDRLTRQPRDMEDLLDIGKETGLRLLSPTGQYNLADPDHQMMLRWMVARAVNEVDNLSRRMKAGHERRRRDGIVRKGGRGGRPYGFEADGVTHRPDEVALLREAAERILAGEGAGVICRDWNARGFRTVTGGRWAHGTVKKMLLRPRVAGLMPDGESKAGWAPLLDDDPVKARERWEAVCAVLEGRAAAFAYTTNARAHLLSGWATCGPCENPQVIRHNARGKQLLGYGCNMPGCRKTHRAQPYLDAYVTGHVLELLSDAEFIAELAAPADEGAAAEITELEARKAAAEESLARLVDNPHVKPELLAESIAGFAERIADKRRAIAMSARSRLLLEYAGIGEETFAGLPLGTRRALVQATYRVVVWPVAKKGPGFETDTIDLVPVEE